MLRAFFTIASLAGQTEIADPITAPFGPTLDMLYLQWNIFGPTVATGLVPLLQEVFSCFVACQRPPLIGAPRDFRVLHRLQVEADQFHADCDNGAKLPRAFDPCYHVPDATFQ